MSELRSPSRRALLRWAGAATGVALLASCASVMGPREVSIPLTRLQGGLERHFPYKTRLMQLFELRLFNPQLALLPDVDRVTLTLDAGLAPPFGREAWRGNMTVSGRLFIDAGRRAVMLAEPRLERLHMGQDGADVQRQVTQLANGLIETMARDMVLYEFRDDELRYAGIQFVPLRIQTRRSGLLITLTPAG